MREIQSSLAKTHLPQLLDEVERGETIVITRHGRAIARLVPEVPEPERVKDVLDRVRAFRRTMPRLTLDEIDAARHEGHKY